MSTAPILFVPGSLRADSFTTKLLKAAAAFVPAGHPVEFADLVRQLPFYDSDIEGENAPDAVKEVRARISASAGVVVSTPEYNGGLPGGLKNLFDWATRPMGAHSLVGKPIAVIGASPGPRGATGAVESVTFVLGFLGAKVIADPVTVGEVIAHLGADGTPDEEVSARLAALVGRLITEIETPAAEPA